MSVALANGASVVAFIGLAGQTASGLLFLHDFIEDLKDAPGLLQNLYQDLTIFQISLDSFQETASEAARLRTPTTLGFSTIQILNDAGDSIKPILITFPEVWPRQSHTVEREDSGSLENEQTHEIFQATRKVILIDDFCQCKFGYFRHNLTLKQSDSAAQQSSISTNLWNEVLSKMSVLDRSVQASMVQVHGIFTEIASKVNQLPDDVDRQLDNHFSELSLIAETTRKTFFIVHSRLGANAADLSDAVSDEIQQVIRNTIELAISQAADRHVAIADIEAIMRQVLLEHNLHITRDIPSTLPEASEASNPNEDMMLSDKPKSSIIKIVISKHGAPKLFTMYTTLPSNDKDFSVVLKKLYKHIKGGSYSWRGLLTMKIVTQIKLVKFGDYGQGVVNVRSGNDLPPSTSPYKYYPNLFEFRPLYFSRIFVHFFYYPHHTSDRHHFLSQIPQILETDCVATKHGVHESWGLQIVEAWSWRKITIGMFASSSLLSLLTMVLATYFQYNISFFFNFMALASVPAILSFTGVQMVLQSL